MKNSRIAFLLGIVLSVLPLAVRAQTKVNLNTQVTGILNSTALPTTGVTPGSCGDTTHSCSLTIDSKGRITAQANNLIAANSNTSNAVHLSPNCGSQANCFPVYDDTRLLWTCTWSASNAVITCPSGTFAAGDVGKIAFASNAPYNGGTGLESATLVCPQTTIKTFSSSSSVTLNANCTIAGTSSPYSLFIFGSDDTANIAAAWPAVSTPYCGYLSLPAGNMMVQAGEFQNQTCEHSATSVTRADVTVAGSEMGNTSLVMTPNFNTATCTSGKTAGACFGGTGNGTGQNASGPNFKFLSFFGAGLNPTISGYVCATELSTNNFMLNVSLLGWGGSTPQMYGICVQTSAYTVLQNVEVDGVGELGEAVGGSSSLVNQASVYIGDELNGNVIIQGESEVYSSASGYGPCSGAGCTIVNALNGRFHSGQDRVFSLSATGAHVFKVTTGTVRLVNCFCEDGSVNGDTVDLTGSGASLYASNSDLSAVASGSQTFSTASGSSLYDLGGNNFTTTASNSISGNVFGEASATGVPVASSNLVRSTGWGTGNTVTALQGANSPISFTITNGSGSTGASPTITYTFPTPYLQAPLWCTATQVGGTNANGTFTSSSLSAAGVTFTYSLTPTANDTEIVQLKCDTQ